MRQPGVLIASQLLKNLIFAHSHETETSFIVYTSSWSMPGFTLSGKLPGGVSWRP
jgi:hypothetical protein